MKSPALTQGVRLNNGTRMPIFGLGVWEMKDGKETEQAVAWALEAGYRHFDTAKLYGNETSVGKVVRESGIPRAEIFITTKLWPTDFFNPRSAFEKSLSRLGLECIDLYLIHWPAPIMPQSIWRALEKICDEKLAMSIGVSNYDESNLEDLLGYARIAPAVNQVKFSPFDYKKSLLEYCKSKHIALTAYSPLTRGRKLSDKTIEAIAKKYNKTPAQIMIRWCIEHEVIVIPKSSNRERIVENANVFDFSISVEDMQTLNTLS